MNLIDYFRMQQKGQTRKVSWTDTCSYCGAPVDASQEDGPCPTQVIDEAARALA